jgi:hypothetical protein
MIRPSIAPAAAEDIRFTSYRLEVAGSMPRGAYRDALVRGIAARLAALDPGYGRHDSCGAVALDRAGSDVAPLHSART